MKQERAAHGAAERQTVPTRDPGAAGQGRPSGSEERGRASSDTAGRLRAAAAALFRRQGFRATGLRQVAAAAGVAVGTVYTHYPDKAALLEAVLEEVAAGIRRRLAWVRLTPGRPAAERWERFRLALAEALPWLACEEEAAGAAGWPARAGAAGRAGGPDEPAAPTGTAGPVTSIVLESLSLFLEEGARRREIRLPLPDPGASAAAVLAAALGLWRAGWSEALDLLWAGLDAGREDTAQRSRVMPESTWWSTQ